MNLLRHVRVFIWLRSPKHYFRCGFTNAEPRVVIIPMTWGLIRPNTCNIAPGRTAGPRSTCCPPNSLELLLESSFLSTCPPACSLHSGTVSFRTFCWILGCFSYPFVQSRTLSPAHPQGIRPWPPIWCHVLHCLGHILSHFQLFNLNADQYQVQYQLLWNTPVTDHHLSVLVLNTTLPTRQSNFTGSL